MTLHRATSYLLLCTLMAIVGARADAQIPRTISYQGVLADPSGKLVSDGVYTLTLKLYDDLGSSSAVYTETHNATVVRGVFNVIIGSTNPLPASLAFDRAYFLGVSVNSSPEFIPRTPLTSVPYALHAATADQAKGLAPGATGVVTSVNGVQGAVRLKGSGATTINRSGDTIVISSTGGAGGTGIQGVQSPGSTLTVADANGPVASVDIADGGVSAAKLANGAVTSSKIGDGAVTSSKIGDGAVSTAKIQDSAVTSTKIRNGSITQEKIAPGVGFPPVGAAGGDLSGTYPNPAVAPNAITTAKIADDAITSAKIAADAVANAELANDAVTSTEIANGTITGADISNAANLSIATLGTTGNAGIGVAAGTSRLAVKGSGATPGSSSLDISNNNGATLLYVRDDGVVGIGTANPGASLEIAGTAGFGLRVMAGGTTLSTTAVPAAAAIPVVNNTSVVRITDDGANVNIVVNLPAGTPGQIVIISNDDAVNIAGVVAAAALVNPGQTRMFVFNGAAWRLVN